jgi:fluoroacetyl-CoA thioesterase
VSGQALEPGLCHSARLTITEGLTVSHLGRVYGNFSDMPPVFATAYLVGFVESTCIELLAPHLGRGQQSVGTHVGLSHSAATPVGMVVTAEVELVAVEGRKLRFKVVCRDEADVICEGFHERHLIDAARFMERLARKAAR